MLNKYIKTLNGSNPYKAYNEHKKSGEEFDIVKFAKLFGITVYAEALIGNIY